MGPKWSVDHFGCIITSNRGPQPLGSPSPSTRVATHGKQVTPFSKEPFLVVMFTIFVDHSVVIFTIYSVCLSFVQE